jgi:hypothetical protein
LLKDEEARGALRAAIENLPSGEARKHIWYDPERWPVAEQVVRSLTDANDDSEA